MKYIAFAMEIHYLLERIFFFRNFDFDVIGWKMSKEIFSERILMKMEHTLNARV